MVGFNDLPGSIRLPGQYEIAIALLSKFPRKLFAKNLAIVANIDRQRSVTNNDLSIRR